MIRSPAGFDGGDRIKRYLDYYQPSYGVMMLSAGQFSPLSLFVAGEQGAWYDPSDLSTMFQNSIGTTPVTAAAQPVGLLLDKSKSLALGAELVTNGDFATDTWWAKSGTTISGGAANWSSAGANSWIGRTTAFLTVGSVYQVTWTIISMSAGGLRLHDGSFYWTTQTAPGTYTETFRAGGANFYIISTGASTTASVDNVSIKLISGNHASQANPTSRPTLIATNRIDYDGTNDQHTGAVAGGSTTGFLFVAGVNIDVTGANQTIWSDTGTNTGYRVRINSSNQVELAAGNNTAYTTAVTSETLTAGTNYVIAAWHDGTNLNVKLGTSGTVVSQAFATATAGTTTFTVGMDNGAVSSQLNGKIYNSVMVKNFAGTVTNVDNTIAYVNRTLA